MKSAPISSTEHRILLQAWTLSTVCTYKFGHCSDDFCDLGLPTFLGEQAVGNLLDDRKVLQLEQFDVSMIGCESLDARSSRQLPSATGRVFP